VFFIALVLAIGAVSPVSPISRIASVVASRAIDDAARDNVVGAKPHLDAR